MFKRTEEHLIELLHRGSLLSKEEIREIIAKEKEMGVFDLNKAYDNVFGWIDPD